MRWIISWVGDNDIKAALGQSGSEIGPIADFLSAVTFDRLLFLHDRAEQGVLYSRWINERIGVEPSMLVARMDRPFDFDLVFESTLEAVDRFASETPDFRNGKKSYLLSPGTKAISTALMLIANVKHRGDLYTNWPDQNQPDPRERIARLNYFDRFGLTLWAMQTGADDLDEIQCDPDGREITRMASVRLIYGQAMKVAVTGLPVLIQGETGTGKELLAAFVHRSSTRHRAPFVAVNCGAIPPDLIDSHLFGHVKGAFTGAINDSRGLVGAADKGTLFLDEIGELPMATQARLLRFLQEGEVVPVGANQPRKVDVRVVAATHRDLQARARDESFRQDLYFRLAGYILRLPPLRERLGDLDLICRQIIQKWETDRRVKVRIDVDAWKLLRAYSWPGNVRELQSIMHRCLVDSRQGSGSERVIDRQTVRIALREQGLDYGAVDSPGSGDQGTLLAASVHAAGDYAQAIAEIEATLIRSAIKQNSSQAAAARYLNMSPQGLHGKLKRLRDRGIEI